MGDTAEPPLRMGISSLPNGASALLGNELLRHGRPRPFLRPAAGFGARHVSMCREYPAP